MNESKFKKYEKLDTCFLHICIPYNKNCDSNVFSLYKQFKPEHLRVIYNLFNDDMVKKYLDGKLQSKIPI